MMPIYLLCVAFALNTCFSTIFCPGPIDIPDMKQSIPRLRSLPLRKKSNVTQSKNTNPQIHNTPSTPIMICPPNPITTTTSPHPTSLPYASPFIPLPYSSQSVKDPSVFPPSFSNPSPPPPVSWPQTPSFPNRPPKNPNIQKDQLPSPHRNSPYLQNPSPNSPSTI